MKTNLEQWQEKLGELTDLRDNNNDLFGEINTPTPEQISYYKLNNVQIQREINTHLQALRISIDEEVETLGTLSAILDYGDTNAHSEGLGLEFGSGLDDAKNVA